MVTPLGSPRRHRSCRFFVRAFGGSGLDGPALGSILDGRDELAVCVVPGWQLAVGDAGQTEHVATVVLDVGDVEIAVFATSHRQ